MLQRVITGALIAVIIIAILFSNAAVVSAFVGLLILVAQFEISKVVGLDKKAELVWCNILYSALFIIFICFGQFKYIGVLAAIYIVLLFVVMLFNYERIKFYDLTISIFCMI